MMSGTPRVIQKLEFFEAGAFRFKLSKAGAEGARYWILGKPEANLKMTMQAMKKSTFESREVYVS